MRTTFDATVDFEAEGVLETELTNAMNRVQGSVFAVHVPADGEDSEFMADDTEPSREVGEDDWYVLGRSVEELAMALRALL